MSPTFLVIAHAGEVNGVEQWDEDEYPTMAGAVCALAKWSLFNRDAVIRRVGPDGTVGPVIAELDIPRDRSYEPAIEFRFPSRRKRYWQGLPAVSHLTLRGLLARYGIPE
jgi:hypothetical protein